jgi:hypothetical protein
MRRWLPLLTLGLILGVGLGLLYGWVIRPVKYVDTSPDSLRDDHRADYILMVAEAYSADADLELAQVRLAALGPQPPLEMVIWAIDYGVKHDLPRADLDTLNTLASALRANPQAPEIGGP